MNCRTQTWSDSPALYHRLLQAFADLFDAGVPDREGRLAALFGALPGFLGVNARVSATKATHGWTRQQRSYALIAAIR